MRKQTTATKSKKKTKVTVEQAVSNLEQKGFRHATLQKGLPWHERAQGLPLALFHTTIGPIIGRVDDGAPNLPFGIRLWAPAVIQLGFVADEGQVARHRVVFQPLAFVELYIDLSTSTPFGRSPVPEALASGYEEYFAKVVAGEYTMARTMTRVERAASHVADADVGEEASPANGQGQEGPENPPTLEDSPASDGLTEDERVS